MTDSSQNQPERDDAEHKPDSSPADGKRPDGQKFVELLGTHERALIGYVFSLTGNWDDAQEVMQRVRIRIWEQFEQYDSSKPFGAWARAISYYLVLAYRKEKSRQREYFGEEVMHLLDGAYASAEEEISADRSILIDCLSKLPGSQRDLVMQYYAPGGPEALATSLGKKINAIRQSMFRIRKTLLDCVQRNRNSSLSIGN